MKTLASLLVCCSFLIAIPAQAELRSKIIRIESGGAMTDEAGAFYLLQLISNTSAQPLWLSVRQGEGASACEVIARIEPQKTTPFRCDVAKLEPGRIPVVIAVFADEGRTQNLENHREEMRFTKSQIRDIIDLVQAQRLPVTYEGIAFSEKLGLGAHFRQLIPHASGKLSISASSVEYSDAKRTVTIPAAAIRELDIMRTGGAVPWIIVIYEADGELKRAGFQALNHPEEGGRIMFSLEAAGRKASDGTESVPGDALGDSALRRDTVRSILQSEKELAPACTAPKIVDTKIVEEPASMAVKDGRPVRGNWSERWVVDRCGTQVAYGVAYTTDPAGGTVLAIQKPIED